MDDPDPRHDPRQTDIEDYIQKQNQAAYRLGLMDGENTDYTHNDWLQTFSGKLLRIHDPKPGDISVEDIAHGLANTCRFSGQCNGFYSVAEHAMNVSMIVTHRFPHDYRLQLSALHHDDSEAYMGDLTRCLKHAPALAGYRSIEHRLMGVIGTALGLPLRFHLNMIIKLADNQVLENERRELFGPPPEPWWTTLNNIKPAPDIDIDCMAPHIAEKFFLALHRTLSVLAKEQP